MKQINLIPDLKSEHLKAQRTRNTVISISLLVSGGFVALVVILFLHVNVNQRNHSNNLRDHINELSEEYSSIEDLDKVVTVQRQLESLPSLHDEKPLVSRLPQYLSVITPENIELSEVDLNLEEGLATITGNGTNVTAVNVFTDTIKNATYKLESNPDNEERPFTNVILDTITTDDETSIFEIKLSFDPLLFTSHEKITLTVPEGDFTLSERERPKIDSNRTNDLFDGGEEQ